MLSPVGLSTSSSIAVNQNQLHEHLYSSSSPSANFAPHTQHHTWKLLHTSHFPFATIESGESAIVRPNGLSYKTKPRRSAFNSAWHFPVQGSQAFRSKLSRSFK